MPKFDFEKMLEYTQRFRITDFTLVPPIAVLLAKHPAVEKYDLSSVENVGCGAAPLGRDVSLQVEKRLGNGLNMKQGWGMTEYVTIIPHAFTLPCVRAKFSSFTIC
jgi:4-coumarate--CoA ligase